MYSHKYSEASAEIMLVGTKKKQYIVNIWIGMRAFCVEGNFWHGTETFVIIS